MRFTIVVVGVVAVGFLSACPAHVSLGEIPDARAPLDERAEAYERLRPLHAGFNGRAMPSAGYNAIGNLVLNDGTMVRDPTDLAPAVGPSSSTMEHAQKAADMERVGTVMGTVSSTMAVIGLIGEVTALAVTAPLADDGVALSDTPGGGAVMVGALASAGVALIGTLAIIPAILLEFQAADERQSAFACYDADLKKKLALKPKKKALTDQWEASPAEAPPPATTAADPASSE